MEVRIERDEYRVSVFVNPFSDPFQKRIEIRRERYSEREKDQWKEGKWEPARITWIGGQSIDPNKALRFANALNYAVGLAERIDLDINAKIIEGKR